MTGLEAMRSGSATGKPSLARTARAAPGMPMELKICGMLGIMVPGSLATPWGTIGAYLFLAITIIGAIGVFRLRALKELYRAIPVGFMVVVLMSTLLAGMREGFSTTFLRATPVQNTAFVVLFALSRAWLNRGGEIRKWALHLTAFSVMVSGLAVGEYATKSYISLDSVYTKIAGIKVDDSAFRRAPDSFRAISTAGNPLMLGAFAATAGAGSLAFYLTSSRLIFLCAFCINAAATFVSLSRSCWIALGLSTITLILLYLFEGRQISVKQNMHAVAILMLTTVLLVIPSTSTLISGTLRQAAETTGERISDAGQSISYRHRLDMPQVAFEDMISHPASFAFGFGLGAENLFFLSNMGLSLTGTTAKDTMLLRTFDNTFVTVAYSFGMVGFFWFVHAFVSSMWHSVRENYRISLWKTGMLVAVAASIYFFNGFGSPLITYLMACLLGFGAKRKHLPEAGYILEWPSAESAPVRGASI